MPFTRATFDALSQQAASAEGPYERFDFLWKAFNHYYESLYAPKDGNDVAEWQLIHRAVETLPPTSAFPILRSPALRKLADIPPVFDEKIWNRFGKQSRRRHSFVRKTLRELQEGAEPKLDHVKVVTDLLYVIRCNLAHGFKTPEGPRDVEVLGAACPVLDKIVASIPLDAANAARVVA